MSDGDDPPFWYTTLFGVLLLAGPVVAVMPAIGSGTLAEVLGVKGIGLAMGAAGGALVQTSDRRVGALGGTLVVLSAVVCVWVCRQLLGWEVREDTVVALVTTLGVIPGAVVWFLLAHRKEA